MEYQMSKLTATQKNTISNAVANDLVINDIIDPRYALTVGFVFTQTLPSLLKWDMEDFSHLMDNYLLDATVDGEYANISSAYIVYHLIELGYIETLLDTDILVATDKLNDILDRDNKSSSPKLAKDGVTRRKNYCKNTPSKLMQDAIHVLEDTQFKSCEWMLDLARDVWTAKDINTNVILTKQMYVMEGTAEMIPEEAYVSEFFGDLRARLYQADCRGPNGQSSDLARAMMDLHGVSKVYDNGIMGAKLWHELADMGNWVTETDMMSDVISASSDSVSFIIKHIDSDYNISKVWNFVKFSVLWTKLASGEKPYLGVAIGPDAKGSGPQLGACMVADQAMLKATGFSMKKLDDVYHNAIKECVSVGITGLDRADIKKPFMAIFYGAGKDSMMDVTVIEEGAYNKLYSGLSIEEIAERAEVFYKAVNKSFGLALNKLRSAIKQAGFDYDLGVTKYSKKMSYNMPDGFEVLMNYKYSLDLDGNPIEFGKTSSVCTVTSNFETRIFKNSKFTTNEVDLPSFARTGFVNMIQATDALLARLIVVHADRLGCSHILAIHDCFRTNVHDTEKLDEAIKAAYLELFSNMKDVPTDNMPLGTDIIGSYFKGNLEATKEEYKGIAPMHSQFFRNGTRLLRTVDGIWFKDLVNALGTTYYFA